MTTTMSHVCYPLTSSHQNQAVSVPGMFPCPPPVKTPQVKIADLGACVILRAEDEGNIDSDDSWSSGSSIGLKDSEPRGQDCRKVSRTTAVELLVYVLVYVLFFLRPGEREEIPVHTYLSSFRTRFVFSTLAWPVSDRHPRSVVYSENVRTMHDSVCMRHTLPLFEFVMPPCGGTVGMRNVSPKQLIPACHGFLGCNNSQLFCAISKSWLWRQLLPCCLYPAFCLLLKNK